MLVFKNYLHLYVTMSKLSFLLEGMKLHYIQSEVMYTENLPHQNFTKVSLVGFVQFCLQSDELHRTKNITSLAKVTSALS